MKWISVLDKLPELNKEVLVGVFSFGDEDNRQQLVVAKRVQYDCADKSH